VADVERYGVLRELLRTLGAGAEADPKGVVLTGQVPQDVVELGAEFGVCGDFRAEHDVVGGAPRVGLVDEPEAGLLGVHRGGRRHR
jgi:hypothetical protein